MAVPVAGFRRLDFDHDGKIGAGELEFFLKDAYGDDAAEQALQVLRTADMNNDGIIDMAEFKAASGHFAARRVARLFYGAACC